MTLGTITQQTAEKTQIEPTSPPQLRLPNELLAELVDCIPNGLTYNLAVASQLYCREPSNWFEHFLQKHFVKHFVRTKNKWYLGQEERASSILELDKQNPLVVRIIKERSSDRIRGWRPFSPITGHTYFEVKLLARMAESVVFYIGVVLDSRMSMIYGCMMSTKEHEDSKLDGRTWINRQHMVVGDVFGCGVLVPPPSPAAAALANERNNNNNNGDDDDGAEKTTTTTKEPITIFITINGQCVVEHLKLPTSIDDYSQLYPSIIFHDQCVFEANFGASPFQYDHQGQQQQQQQ